MIFCRNDIFIINITIFGRDLPTLFPKMDGNTIDDWSGQKTSKSTSFETKTTRERVSFRVGIRKHTVFRSVPKCNRRKLRIYVQVYESNLLFEYRAKCPRFYIHLYIQTQRTIVISIAFLYVGGRGC